MRTVGSLALQESQSVCPLVVDLDGTVIRSNMLFEALCRLVKDNPGALCLIPYWLYRGKAVLKEQLALRASVDPGGLPYNHEFVAWLTRQRARGRTLILCTGSHETMARAIAAHLGMFDDVMASDGETNLAGRNKAEALVRRFGSAGFDYAGNSRDDFAVWRSARRAVVVCPSAHVAKRAPSCGEVELVFPSSKRGLEVWRRLLRVHQWSKNLLLGVPIVAAHRFMEWEAWQGLGLAFLSFSLCASAVYMTNDLLDLESDRRHPKKCTRPFACGQVPVWVGFVLVPLLLLSSFALARHVGGSFVAWLLAYAGLTTAYSWWLKRLLLVDCLTLAMLYTARIVAGGAVIHVHVSFWLLAFSCFLFLSLAFAKRYAELRLLSQTGKEQAHGRAYWLSDSPLIQMLGIASGYAAVLVFALYLNSDAVLQLYRAPEYLWGAVPVTVFWISWMWMQAHRGALQEDAVVFALTDRTSLLAGIALAVVFGLATVGWLA
ncbi:MAG TPA: UbiA family prenyltransferase [Nitrospira sp.]|nr:UbiA family prenyltransferase [Nitrospira sp.]